MNTSMNNRTVRSPNMNCSTTNWPWAKQDALQTWSSTLVATKAIAFGTLLSNRARFVLVAYPHLASQLRIMAHSLCRILYSVTSKCKILVSSVWPTRQIFRTNKLIRAGSSVDFQTCNSPRTELPSIKIRLLVQSKTRHTKESQSP